VLHLESVLLALGAVVMVGCSEHAARGPNNDPRAPSVPFAQLARAADPPPPALVTAAPPAPDPLPPLEAPNAVVDLPVRGFLPAIAMIPVGSTAPRPVVVATHGLGGGPQWVCPLWRDLVGAGVFVLCPRGQRVPGQRDDIRPNEAAYRYPTWETLEAEIEAGLAALRARFPGRVDDGPVLYAGFSQGANMGVAVMAKQPSRYRRAVLTEGGHWRWTAERARAYAEGGGERVLFACGRTSCVKEAAASVALLEAAGVKAKIVAAEGAGHVATGPVAAETRGALDWVFEGEDRWARLDAQAEASPDQR
jgi:predicted esterase